MSHRFIMRIGRQPQGPKPKPVRATRAPHWIDWLPKWIAIAALWGAAAVLWWERL